MAQENKSKNIVRLFILFLKVSTFTFSGGLAMLPIIQKEVIDKYHMMDEEEFIEYIALAQSLPGVIALNTAIFVGKRVAGIFGAIISGIAVILPALVFMLAAVLLLTVVPESEKIDKALKGIQAASSALILSSAIKLGKKALKDYIGWVLMGLSFILVGILKFNIFIVIIMSGIVGIIYYGYVKKGGEVVKK